MNTQQQNDRDTYRLIITRRSGSELLCLPDGPYHSLPSVDIPRWQRVAEPIKNAVKTHLDLDAYSLFTCPCETSTSETPRTLFQVMECVRPDGPVPPTVFWVPVSSLMIDSFRDAQDLRRICNALRPLSRDTETGNEGPFAKPGWLRDLCGWIAQQIEPLKFRLTGNFRQLNASASFSLIRFETTDAALWFKAVGAPNLHEYAISQALARSLPNYVPSVLATKPEWHGWLMADGGSVTLNDVQDPAAWQTALTTFANLQIESIGLEDEFLEAGCRDLRLEALLELVDSFLDAMADLMKQQSKVPPPILSQQQLLDMRAVLKDALQCLGALRIPDALGHSDFNPGNIIVGPERCTFLDWSEAYVGHPFLTSEYFLAHLRKGYPELVPLESELRASYSCIWRSVASPEQIAQAYSFSPLVAVYAYAVSSNVWRDPERLKVPGFQGYLRSLTRRMKQEADSIQRRRVQCLN
ncbi:MAG: phosphotransferase [Candidatus Acidiferrum sp.]